MKTKLLKLLAWVVDCWRLVMDNRYNPLRYIADPSLQLYFTLVLFTMWSVYFGFVAAYYMGWLGYDIVTSIIVHIAVVLPVGFTNAIFIDAERDGAKWLKDIKDKNGNIIISSGFDLTEEQLNKIISQEEKVLQIVNKNEINLTNILSRPVKKNKWQYSFFLEFSGHASDKNVSKLFKELQKVSYDLKVLGSYPAAY